MPRWRAKEVTEAHHRVGFPSYRGDVASKEVIGSMVRRSFDREFRHGAVRIVRETGTPNALGHSGELGRHEGTLGRWVNLDRRAREGEGPLSESERYELNRMRGNRRAGDGARCTQALGCPVVKGSDTA